MIIPGRKISNVKSLLLKDDVEVEVVDMFHQGQPQVTVSRFLIILCCTMAGCAIPKLVLSSTLFVWFSHVLCLKILSGQRKRTLDICPGCPDVQ